MIIRDVKVEDFKEISNIRKMNGVIENILATSDENSEKIKDKILKKDNDEFWVVAELNNKVVGVAILNRYRTLRKRHVGCISLMVHSKYQGKGVGKILMEKLIDLGNKELGLKRLELEVFKENIKAITLYKKYGFKEEGIKVKSALRMWIFSDEIIMAKLF